MERLNDFYLWITGLFAGLLAWVVRRLFRSVDKAHSRITILEKNIVDRAYLESQLAPIRQDLNLILSHLLEHRQTEQAEATKQKDRS